MNNVSGFSGALVTSNPVVASEPKTGGDSVAKPKGQSFETLLTGLSQQSETPVNSPSSVDTLTGQGGARSPSLHSNALTLLTQAVTPPASRTAAASQASGKATGQNQAAGLSTNMSAESPVAAATTVPGTAGRGAPSRDTTASTPTSDRAPEQKAASITRDVTPASRPQSSTAQTQSTSAQRQPSNTASINVSASQPISAANDAASTASLEVASSAAATSVSQKSPESGQSTSTRERRHSAVHASSQTQPQPATNVTAGALLAATANVPPASVQQAVTADSGSLSDTGDNDAPGGGASSLTDETAVTKMALTSHGATSKSDSTEDSTPIKVDVVSQATYFAPVASLSPAQQIASAVAPLVTSSDAAAQDSSTTSSARAATPVTDIGAMLAAAQPSLSAVKTLDLQIEPPDLGTVNVKISLSDGGLQVEVQASQSTTRDLLEKDKQELTDRLADTGYTVASVDISLAASSGATNSFADQGAAGQNSSGQTSEGGSQGYSGSQAQDGGANNSPQRQSQRQSGNETYETARSAPRRSAGAGLYI